MIMLFLNFKFVHIFLALQVDTGKRAELVQWLAKVSRQFKYEMETFLLTVNYVDRFLVTTPLAFSCLQLLGVAALLVASKKVSQPNIQLISNIICK